MRPGPCTTLLDSVDAQTLRPDEILIIDGSRNEFTAEAIAKRQSGAIRYFKVPDEHRGLTRQRNYGIARVEASMKVICFLDDDTVLDPDYFEQLIGTYKDHPEALGVGGYIINESRWTIADAQEPIDIRNFYYDGWKVPDGSRFVLRKRLGLNSDVKPAFAPEFSHGRSVGFLPPSGKTYPAQQLMGGVSSFRKEVFDRFSFSEYFEGYGLYEDADFTLRLSKSGPLFVNTAARLSHYHDHSGRPDKFRYGKMVVRNGWYVWRVAWPNPSLKARLKWHAITLLLAGLRFLNFFTGKFDREALSEAAGRFSAWIVLFFDKPRIEQ